MKSNKLALSVCQPEDNGVGTSCKQGIEGAGGRGLGRARASKGKGPMLLGLRPAHLLKPAEQACLASRESNTDQGCLKIVDEPQQVFAQHWLRWCQTGHP